MSGPLSWLRPRGDVPPPRTGAAPAAVASGAPGGAAGLTTLHRADLPAMSRFDDIDVVPAIQKRPMILTGGPVWPDWDGADDLRHKRNGLPIDEPAPRPAASAETFDHPAVWGAHAVDHFGHFVAENSTRILQAVSDHPEAKLLMTLEPGLAPKAVPGFLWQVLDWYGVAPKRVEFVTRPLRVRQLWAAEMAEQLNGVPPGDAYLDLLAANAARNGLKPVAADTVYVARDRMQNSAEGHNAGEPYLTGLLERLGVTVLRPETMPLRKQLAIYAGARTLIFAEGSAMHGRQLLGRLDQTVAVLNRRPRMRTGMAALLARCRHLAYGEVTRGTAAVLWPGGKPWMVRAISIYDTDRLLATFEALGVPLRSVWNDADYLAARDVAIRKWIAIRLDAAQPIDHAASRTRVRTEFRALGLDHLLAGLPEGDAP